MATIKFYTNTKKTSHPAPLYVKVSIKRDIQPVCKTGIFVYPEYWNRKTQRFINKIRYSEHYTVKDQNKLHERIKDLDNHISKEINRNNGAYTTEWLKTIVAEFVNPDSLKVQTLNGYIELFISQAETGKRLTRTNKRHYTPLSIKNLKSFKKLFFEYQDVNNCVIDFNDITIDFYHKFIEFLTGKDYKTNSIGRQIKHLKTIMNAAFDEEQHTNTANKLDSFSAPTENVDNIYLSIEELRKIFELDLSGKPTLELVRDVFLIGCYTAQRYSDYSRIRDYMIKETIGYKYLKFQQQKTNIEVIVPLRPEADFLLSKYDYNVPKTYAQKVNDRIKTVCKMAGINEVETIEGTKGGMRYRKQLPKYELVKTHTARRSGCTNMYLAGIPTLDIMKISGHQTESEFLKYIKVTKQQTADRLADNQFFKGPAVNLKIAK